MHQSLQGATFHVEHVIPRCAGGSDKLDNLAWACPSCDLHKADRIIIANSPGISGSVSLFNPRRERWAAHFEWDGYSLVGKAEVGRVTIFALLLNHQRRLMIRRAEQLFGMFPPDA